MADTEWCNHGNEIFETEKSHDEVDGIGRRAANFTSGAIKKASLQWYKMKWQFTASANELWGEEVQGYAEVVQQSPLANCDLFADGKVTPIRMRYFNMIGGDDASNDIRCAFLKFGDRDEEGPLDLAFSTGRVALYDSVSSLQTFLTAVDGDDDNVRDWTLLKPQNYFALVDGIRRYPSCYTALDYNNHATFSVDTDSGRKLIRFRLHGNNDMASRLTRAEQEEAWVIGRPDIELPSDTYLKQRLHNITNENSRTVLQVQIRDHDNSSGTSALFPSEFWDEANYPWQALANIVLTYSVPKESMERAVFNFTRQPDYIRLETAPGTDNFGGLVNIREKVLTSTTRKKKPEAQSLEQTKMTTYLIHVETGNSMFSGTDASVYISLYGTKGRTKKVLLDKLFHDDFERGSKEAYYITVPVIGELLFVKVYLLGGKFTIARDWFLSNIVIFNLSTRKLNEIPCYRWVSDVMILPIGKATLHQNETNIDRIYLRRLYIEGLQTLVPWGQIDGLPGAIGYSKYADLPMDLKFATERDIEKKIALADILLKLKLHQYVNVMSSFDSLDAFKAMADVVPKSEVSEGYFEKDNWKSDEEYGRATLNGVNPVMIRQCTKTLDKFPVSNELVGPLLDRGLSLEEEIKAGHVYYIDYRHLEGIPRKTGETPAANRYLANPIIMFYVRATGDLVPIAIQLEQKPGPDNPIFTPQDSEMDWLLAKIFVKSADVHYQAMYSHLLRVHLIMESLSIACFRQLPVNHPVYKLLIQHTRYTVAGAQKGRDLLLFGENSVFQKILSIPGREIEFMARVFEDFHINELIAPKDFSSRGVNDATKLPKYHYRDDSMKLWDKLSEFVSKMMSRYYKSDNDVKNDFELQAFVKDICTNGLPNKGKHSNGVPDKLHTREEMIEYLTMFIFHSSCYHSALNYPQLDYFKFGPNYPSALRKPPPKTKGETTLQVIMDTLPCQADQTIAIAFASYLCEHLCDEQYLPDTTDGFFTEVGAREIIDWFSDELSKISHDIKERNTTIPISYEYLLPENIPKSAGQ